MKKPWEGYIKPFRIFGNLYFVGTRPASAHLIDTGEGLILLDSGYPQTLYLVTEGIREMGFSPKDIKIILHSHGHYDHLGATRALIALTGAKTAIGAPDVDYANGKLDLTWAKELGHTYEEAFEPDIILQDGNHLRLGNTDILCISTPGHTPGTFSFFFNVTDGEHTYRAGTFGGAGLNTLKKAFLEQYDLPFSCRQDYYNSLEKIRNQHVDIFIGNHVGNNQTEEKGQQLEALRKEAEHNPKMLTEAETDKNPFVNPLAWGAFLDACKDKLDLLLSDKKEEE